VIPRHQRKHHYRAGNLLKVIQYGLHAYDPSDEHSYMQIVSLQGEEGCPKLVEIKWGTLCLLLERDRKVDRAHIILIGDKKYKVFGNIQHCFAKAWL